MCNTETEAIAEEQELFNIVVAGMKYVGLSIAILLSQHRYLVVGRFVPEVSFEAMISEFMKSKSEKDFALITNVNEKY